MYNISIDTVHKRKSEIRKTCHNDQSIEGGNLAQVSNQTSLSIFLSSFWWQIMKTEYYWC